MIIGIILIMIPIHIILIINNDTNTYNDNNDNRTNNDKHNNNDNNDY